MPAWADQSSGQDQSDNQDRKASAADRQSNGNNGPGQAWIGVAVEPIHPGFLNHLAPAIGGAYGLMVDDVAEDSPADHAGLEEGDILTRYGDQKLFSPEQLLGLIRIDEPGQQKSLTVLRDGKTQELTVTLGNQRELQAWQRQQAFSRSTGNPAANQSVQNRRDGGQGTRTAARDDDEDEDANESAWNIFDSMTLAQTGKNRFKVQIRYRDENGKIETRRFEGSPGELQKDITSQKDLPKSERDHLLNALNLTQVLEPAFEQDNSGKDRSRSNNSPSKDSSNDGSDRDRSGQR